jgi:DNA-directed RNA polymerase subunit RPC12/RpoP
MAYKCPRCGRPVKRDINPEAGRRSGLLGIFFSAASATFVCPKCGWIRLREFSIETRVKMILASILIVIGAIGLVIGLLYFLDRISV